MIVTKTVVNAKTGDRTVIEREATQEEIEQAIASKHSAAKRNRLTAYRAEADPLFFQWQAGEATEQEWLDARNAVRERYPYPE